MKEGQIKGEKHLAELTEAIDFLSNKFEDYETDMKEKKGRIKALEECLTSMSKRVGSLSSRINRSNTHDVIVYCYTAFLKTRMKKLIIYASLL